MLLVVDPTPMRRGTDDLKAQVAEMLRAGGWAVEACVAATDSAGQAHTDMEHTDAVRHRIHAGTAIVSLGSGTITDTAKHAAHLFEQVTGTTVPYVAVPTANSVSAYTSNMAPTRVHGVKRTLPSRYPDAVVCDLQVLRDAPYPMTAAGVGDLLAAFVSLPDWRLANRLGMDPTYSRLPRMLMGSLEQVLLAEAPEIASRSMEGMRSLAKWIALAGLSMSLAHATTPMSGFEHVVSHLLDLQAEQRGEPLAMHGSQVGLASILGLVAYRCLLDDLDPRILPLESMFP